MVKTCGFESEIALLVHMTQHYDMHLACQRNQSLDYFCRRFRIL